MPKIKLTRIVARLLQALRYGENPGDGGWLFSLLPHSAHPMAFQRFWTATGQELSSNNLSAMHRLVDTMTRLEVALIVNEQKERYPFAIIIAKHGIPCAAVVGKSPAEVITKAIRSNPLDIFGGEVITNFPINAEEGSLLSWFEMSTVSKRIFDLVLAPHIDSFGVEWLKRAKDRCVMYENPRLGTIQADCLLEGVRWFDALKVLVKTDVSIQVPCFTDQPDERQRIRGPHERIMDRRADLSLAWAVASTSAGNAISATYQGVLVATMSGQTSRAKAALFLGSLLHRVGYTPSNDFVACSNGFVSFDDVVQSLYTSGVRLLLAPRGSVRDESIGQYAQTLPGFTLVTYPDRWFSAHRA